MKGLTAWEWLGISANWRISSNAHHLDARQGTRVPITELRKTETEMAVDAVVNKNRAARKAFSSGPDINAGAEEYERKQREEIITGAYRMQGPRRRTDGAQSDWVSAELHSYTE